MRRTTGLGTIVLVIALTAGGTSSLGAGITPVGVLDPANPASGVYAISPSGAYAVGYSNVPDSGGTAIIQQPIIWDQGNGLQQLPLPGGAPEIDSQAWGVVEVPTGGTDAPAGAPAVGLGVNANNQMYMYKALQSDLTGGQYYANIFGASGVIGAYNAAGTHLTNPTNRWFVAGQRLTGTRRGLVDGLDGGGAADMRFVGHAKINSMGGSGFDAGVGWDSGNPGSAHRAVWFNAPNGTTQTAIPGGAGVLSEGFGVSPSVQWFSGFDTDAAGTTQAFKWQNGDAAMTLLGRLAGDTDSSALDINDAGIAVGYSSDGVTEQAVVWDSTGTWDNTGQARTVMELLAAAGFDVSDWTGLSRATTMTDDGLTVAGFGVWAADGSTRGFIATIPEPATLSLLTLGGLFLLRRRRSVPVG